MYTPGPWEFDGRTRIDAVALRKPTGHMVKNDDGTESEWIGGLIALAYSCGGGDHAANSRLIADAPTLLDVLRQIVHEYDQTYDAESDGGTWKSAASVPAEVMQRAASLVKAHDSDSAAPRRYIELTPAEIQSNHNRLQWAEGLIRQLPETHEGRNSWLLNYGTSKD